MDLVLAPSLDAMPPGCAALFSANPLASAGWYRTAAAHALPAGAAACFAVLVQDGQPCALVPLRQDSGRLSSLTTPYTCVHWPLLHRGAAPALVQAAACRFGQFCRAWPTVRLDAIPAEWEHLTPFLAGLREAGLRVQRFEHFGNWHEPVRGRDWAAYLASRPGALRETIRRKLKRSSAQFEVFTAPPGLERGIDAFEAVYRASWKAPEPFPNFNAALMRHAAGQGTLRLGVLWADGRPAAAQYWIVSQGRATVLKLAHDEAFKPLSPGTVLTAMMVRGLLNQEQVTELDFGRGDDAYKALLTTQRRVRVGLVLMNPWRPAGLLAIGRSMAGGLRQRLATPG